MADSGRISVNFKLARRAPPQNSTVNPLLLQPIIHVWHIRGKVHTGILRSQHYYYDFFFFYVFLWNTSGIRPFFFNSCKHFGAYCCNKWDPPPRVPCEANDKSRPSALLTAALKEWLIEKSVLLVAVVNCSPWHEYTAHSQPVVHTSPLLLFPFLAFRSVARHS